MFRLPLRLQYWTYVVPFQSCVIFKSDMDDFFVVINFYVTAPCGERVMAFVVIVSLDLTRIVRDGPLFVNV